MKHLHSIRFFALIAFLVCHTGLVEAQYTPIDWKKEKEQKRFIASSGAGYYRKVEKYLQNGLDPNYEMYGGTVAIESASTYGHLDVVQLLVRYGAKITQHALSQAVSYGHLDVVEYMLKNGVKIDDNTFDNGLSAYDNREEMVKLLLRYGGDMSSAEYGPGRLAAQNDHESLGLLITEGVNINVRSGFDDNTPLHEAAIGEDGALHENEECIALLLEAGANVDVRNKNGETPVMVAAYHANPKNFMALVEAGADLSLVDHKQRTVMEHAQLHYVNRDIVRYLESVDFTKTKNINNTEERLTTYKRLFDKGEYRKAMILLREEIDDPRPTQDFSAENFVKIMSHIGDVSYTSATDEYRAILHSHAIVLLKNIGEDEGFTQQLFEEASAHFKTGLRYAEGHPVELSYLYQNMGQLVLSCMGFIDWYDDTNQINKSLQYFNKSIELAESSEETIPVLLAYGGLAQAYEIIGQIDFSRYYWDVCFDRAKDYFLSGNYKVEKNEWFYFFNIVSHRFYFKNETFKASEYLTLVEPVKARITNSLVYPSSYYAISLELLAYSGHINEARMFLPELKKQLDKEKRKFPDRYVGDLHEADYQLKVRTATLSMLSGTYPESISDLITCRNNLEKKAPDKGSVFDANLAYCYENLGDYRRAISFRERAYNKAEEDRSLYSVEQIETLLESRGRRLVYKALYKDYAMLFLQGGHEADFVSSLHISEKLRSRKLTDKVSYKGNVLDDGSFSLSDIRAALGPDEALLQYMVIEPEFVKDDYQVICTFIDDKSLEIVINSIDYQHLKKQILDLQTGLSTPSSNVQELNMNLLNLSKLLFDGIDTLIENKKTIYFLTDGILSKLPFELLSLSSSTYKPMFLDKSILMLPSINYMLIKRMSPEIDENTLFAMADPVYNNGYYKSLGFSDQDKQNLQRGSRYLGYFAPLPETSIEVATIGGLFPPGNVEVVSASEATESYLKNLRYFKAKYIHIACHGVLSNEIPGINEPALVLSDEIGEDGFFMASEAEKLRLSAELTVLSACNTGAGEFMNGQGVTGMSQAFILAGSKSVLVSLWSVASQATVKLMTEFYEHLLQGTPKAEALRLAKLSVKNDFRARTSHPFYWAPFILYGY